MAQQTMSSECNPVAIISPHFIAPHPVDLTIVRKVLKITDGNFIVNDVNGNFMFKVKAPLLSLHDRRTILDSADRPIVSLRHEVLTSHSRWQVFRGESLDEKDLIFSAKTSSIIQLKTKLHVFLANNTSRGSLRLHGEGKLMHKKLTAKSILIGKDTFNVTVYPNTDYGFIVALIVILDGINSQYNPIKYYNVAVA
ncbi:hypothetical protein RD792_011032 [Penstemon davidsonii]|uniref:Protein LURP-one-related 10-like n=1 Tax=Penstemon davidsonii TaxID=160366 RepID=A0ABR0D3G7_9LAMI|nr:hypothetical protein RD792_011032 [Penstemon davidsonii]